MSTQNIPRRFDRKLDQFASNGLHNAKRGNWRRAHYWRRRMCALLESIRK